MSAAIILRASAGGVTEDDHWYQEEVEYNFVETLTLIALVFLALCFQTGWHHCVRRAQRGYRYGDILKRAEDTKHSAKEAIEAVRHLRLSFELVSRAGGEFMTLGFLAFVIYSVNQASGFRWLQDHVADTDPAGHWRYPDTELDWFHIAENVHMKLFLGMVLYFFLISRMAAGGVRQIHVWEECSLRSRVGGETVEAEDADLAEHILWRRYFFVEMVRLQCRHPGEFQDVLKVIDFHSDRDKSPDGLLRLLERDFPLGAYISANVEKGVGESIRVRKSTWLFLLIVFVAFACLNRFAGISLLPITPVVAAVAIVFFLLTQCVILRTRSRIYRRVHALDSAYTWPSPSPPAAGPRLRRRWRQDLLMLRAMQLVLFLISYMFGRTLLDFHDWRKHPGASAPSVCLYMLLFVVLAHELPRSVPHFLGMMALPPYVDRLKFATFTAILVRAREENRTTALAALHDRLASSDPPVAISGDCGDLSQAVGKAGVNFIRIVSQGRGDGLSDQDILTGVISHAQLALQGKTCPEPRTPEEPEVHFHAEFSPKLSKDASVDSVDMCGCSVFSGTTAEDPMFSL